MSRVIFFLGHFICQFHFRIVEGELTKHLLQKEGVRFERVVSYLSGKLLLPASKFFQRPVHPEIQDWDCGVGKLDCHLLNAKAHHAVPTQGNLAHCGWLTGDVKSGPACQRQQGAEDSSAQELPAPVGCS